MNSPSEDVSRAIALACSKDSELLVLESYIEKAPKQIVNVLQLLRASTMSTVLSMFTASVTKQEADIIKNKLYEMPLSEFIIQIGMVNITDMPSFSLSNNTYKIEDDNSTINIKLNDDLGIPMIDDSMEPTIMKNSLISFEQANEFKDKDMVAYLEKDKKEIIVRRFYKNGSYIIMSPDNRAKYEPKIYKEKEITILGKVNKIVVKL